MTDRRDGDPAARAIADVERLLAGAKGLQRIVEIARAASDENPAVVQGRGVERCPHPGNPGEPAAADR